MNTLMNSRFFSALLFALALALASVSPSSWAGEPGELRSVVLGAYLAEQQESGGNGMYTISAQDVLCLIKAEELVKQKVVMYGVVPFVWISYTRESSAEGSFVGHTDCGYAVYATPK